MTDMHGSPRARPGRGMSVGKYESLGVSDSGSSMDWEMLRVRLEQVEARAMKEEARAMKAEVRAERAEARAERAEMRAERAETRLENARRRAELAEDLLKAEKKLNREKKVTALAMTDDTSVLSPGVLNHVWDLETTSDDVRDQRSKKRKHPNLQRGRQKYLSAEEAFETPDHSRSPSFSEKDDTGSATELSSEQTVTDHHPDQFRNPRRDARRTRMMRKARGPRSQSQNSISASEISVQSTPGETNRNLPSTCGRGGAHMRDFENEQHGHGRYRSNSMPVTRFDELTLPSEISISVVEAPPSDVARSIPGKLPGYYSSARQLKIIGKKEKFGYYKILGYRFSKSTAKVTNKFIETGDSCRKFGDVPDWHLRKAYQDLRNRVIFGMQVTTQDVEKVTSCLQEVCTFLCTPLKRRDYDAAQLAKMRGSGAPEKDIGGSSMGGSELTTPKTNKSIRFSRQSLRTPRRRKQNISHAVDMGIHKPDKQKNRRGNFRHAPVVPSDFASCESEISQSVDSTGSDYDLDEPYTRKSTWHIGECIRKNTYDRDHKDGKRTVRRYQRTPEKRKGTWTSGERAVEKRKGTWNSDPERRPRRGQTATPRERRPLSFRETRDPGRSRRDPARRLRNQPQPRWGKKINRAC